MTQIHGFWQMIGLSMKKGINDQAIWLNTAGGGVAWLHARLDTRPKYYRYAAYKIVE